MLAIGAGALHSRPLAVRCESGASWAPVGPPPTRSAAIGKPGELASNTACRVALARAGSARARPEWRPRRRLCGQVAGATATAPLRAAASDGCGHSCMCLSFMPPHDVVCCCADVAARGPTCAGFRVRFLWLCWALCLSFVARRGRHSEAMERNFANLPTTHSRLCWRMQIRALAGKLARPLTFSCGCSCGATGHRPQAGAAGPSPAHLARARPRPHAQVSCALVN